MNAGELSALAVSSPQRRIAACNAAAACRLSDRLSVEHSVPEVTWLDFRNCFRWDSSSPNNAGDPGCDHHPPPGQKVGNACGISGTTMADGKQVK